ncbi:DUF58 domain-containing protein [Bacillus horti]|uniref:Uncharacterized protein (DUF58 family) n=1 Tax=Caldalkalibacillus horti TaxID=77523 RepID=A0ABT9W5H5_9BACI|nr:DUF58 domain-containing protein [Bacillus horti]MDQ0168319.1 uncharacterized protein (DUF58 family) [Bacillus horti]
MKNKASYGVWTISILLICAYVYAKFQGGFISWFIFYAFLPIAIMAVGLFLFAFRGVHVVRELKKPKYTAGQTVQVRLRIMNPYRFPFIYLMVKDSLDPRLINAVEDTKKIVLGGFKKEYIVEYSIEDVPRGVFKWNELSIETGDLFGLVKRQHTFSHDNEIVVYPKYQIIRRWRTLNEKNIGTTFSFNRQDEDVSSVMGIRDYAPGDRLARIHWKATARTNSLKTKEYEHQITNDFMFFIDREMKSYGGKGTGGKVSALFERTVSLTASLTRLVLKQHFSAGIVSYGKVATVMNMSKDQEQIFRIYEHLARIEADSTYSFIKTVLREISFLPMGTTVVILTPRLDEKIIGLLNDISYRRIKLEFFWMKGHKEITQQERQYLAMLAQAQINYHIISNDRFEQALSGGDQHVTA